MNVLITGAAGNLGSLLAKHLLDKEKKLNLILMQHRKKVSSGIIEKARVEVRSGDLSKPGTCMGVWMVLI